MNGWFAACSATAGLGTGRSACSQELLRSSLGEEAIGPFDPTRRDVKDLAHKTCVFLTPDQIDGIDRADLGINSEFSVRGRYAWSKTLDTSLRAADGADTDYELLLFERA